MKDEGILLLQSLRTLTRAAWVTDIHLDFLSPQQVTAFCIAIRMQKPDILLVGGDIDGADSVKNHLRVMATMVQCLICLVLKNHDFYRGSIQMVRGPSRPSDRLTVV